MKKHWWEARRMWATREQWETHRRISTLLQDRRAMTDAEISDITNIPEKRVAEYMRESGAGETRDYLLKIYREGTEPQENLRMRWDAESEQWETDSP